MGAPCTFTVPGTVVRVVKSIADTSECVPVSLDISVDCRSTGQQVSACSTRGVDRLAHLAH